MGELITVAKPAWRRVGLIMGAVAACCGVISGCTEGGRDTKSNASPSFSKETVIETPDQEETAPSDSVSVAPKLPGGQVLASAEGRSGNAVLAVKDPLEKGALAIMVKCEGEGRLTVTLKPAGVRFPLECVDGEVSTTYNQVELKRSRESASIEVAARSTVSWALTAGQ
ncbi:hypothetical protein GCM10017771_05600 [Streptomyces capitiformicae]|uniref:Uncharacterized protein n=1 Tax=Streptomyces capitiformicae TaxID=2014920 RepID=A0A919GDG3_9ACTN|nr:hypothetical protein GCM10017771_05600 [Streptomyces capitiformicae]